MQKCKLCLCPKREEIEKQILQGISYNDISATLKAMGFAVSPPSIRRHEMICMGIDKNKQREDNRKFKVKDAIIPVNTGIDINELIEKTKEELENDNMLEVITSNMELSYLLLLKISIKQQAIVLSLTDKFIAGNGKYPLDEIRGMKTIHDLTSDITTFNKLAVKTYNAYPVKHIDRLAEIAYSQGYTNGINEVKYKSGDMFKDEYEYHINPYDKYDFDNLIQRQCKEYENGYIEAKGIEFKNDLEKLNSERYIRVTLDKDDKIIKESNEVNESDLT